MARARNLKPSFFTDDQIAELHPLARLLFAALWCIADREGRLEDRPKRIQTECLPYDKCNVDRLLADLHDGRFIIRYTIDERRYIQIRQFLKHQDPHYKERASEIPSPPGWKDSGKTPGFVSDEMRQRIIERDGRKCRRCGSTESLSVDHIIPRAAGGSHDDANLQTLCRRCNSAKGKRERKPIIEQSSVDDRPTSADDRAMKELSTANTTALIPDSLNLIPDSLNPLTDSLLPQPAAVANGPPNADALKPNGEGSRVLDKDAKPTAETRPTADPWPRRIPEIADQHGLDLCAKAYGIDVRRKHFASYAELQGACFDARNQLREQREREAVRIATHEPRH